MKQYTVDIGTETWTLDATGMHIAVSRAIKDAKAKKLFKDKVGTYLKISVERVK